MERRLAVLGQTTRVVAEHLEPIREHEMEPFVWIVRPAIRDVINNSEPTSAQIVAGLQTSREDADGCVCAVLFRRIRHGGAGGDAPHQCPLESRFMLDRCAVVSPAAESSFSTQLPQQPHLTVQPQPACRR